MPPAKSDFLPTACFSVQARSDPQVMPRVLDQFAKRGLVPTTWHGAAAGRDLGELHIDIQVEGMEGELANRVAECLRRIVGVEAVLTSDKRRAESA